MFEGNYVFYSVLTLLVAVSASYFTNIGLSGEKYVKAKKPLWYPPGYVFGAVWSVIYLLYVYSWTQASYYPSINSLFYVNMLLNFLWCLFFFYYDQWKLALFVLLSLSSVLILQIYSFTEYNKLAAYLLIPYLLWSLFASFLNYTVIVLN